MTDMRDGAAPSARRTSRRRCDCAVSGTDAAIRLQKRTVGAVTYSMQLTQPSTSVPSNAIWRSRM
jgi:hypothetical protein